MQLSDLADSETIHQDGKRQPPARIVAAFCPFCGMKLKGARTG